MRPPPPSSTLLFFLRGQAEGLCFDATPHALRPRRLEPCRIASRRGFNSHPRQIAISECSPVKLHATPCSVISSRCLRSASSITQPRSINRHRTPSSPSFWPRRLASTDSRPFYKRWATTKPPLGSKSPEEVAKELKKGDLPPKTPLQLGEPGATIFGKSKATSEMKLRCTEFDESGNVTLVSGEVKKSELIQKYGLLPRDIRKIDSSLLPSILVRPAAILVNLLHLRVLIKHNCVLIFDAWGSTDTFTQSVFMYDLEGKLMQKESSRAIPGGGLPYEFRALEAVLISVTSCLESEFEVRRAPVDKVLKELEEDIDRDKLRRLLVDSKKLGTFEQKARLVRDAIDAVLDEDEDLSAMYLTDQMMGQEREVDDHTEIEMLLESYHKVCDEIVQRAGSLVSDIRNTEEIIKAILDANRNALMLLDLKFSIGTLGIGSGAFVAALYGMNLKNFIEESDLGFFGISFFSTIITAVVCVYGIRKLQKVQRVSMFGGEGGRGNWREVDRGEGSKGLPGEGREARLRRMRDEKRRVEGRKAV